MHRTAVTELSTSTHRENLKLNRLICNIEALCTFWKGTKNGHLRPPAQPRHAQDLTPKFLQAARRRAAAEDVVLFTLEEALQVVERLAGLVCED